jgi:hypothetical protein
MLSNKVVAGLTLALILTSAAWAQDKPNILVIWGDDIGVHNISAYNHGIMGYKTPNIDRIARKARCSPTPMRSRAAPPGGRRSSSAASVPHRPADHRHARLGSRHPGLGADHRRPAQGARLHLRPVRQEPPRRPRQAPADQHGFDEFFGNLYHLNAEEEPETYYYPKDPEFRKKFGPRGVIHSYADGKIEDTGPLTRKRMETVDEEFQERGRRLHRARRRAADKPFFVWLNSTRMHVWTRLKPESRASTGIGLYPDGMVEHDDASGSMLDKLDELGIADNTIVIYSTDNGAENFTWPDGGITPFHGEKGTTWEGGFRVPQVVRWPGVIEPGTVYQRHHLARGLDADAAGRGRRARHRQGEAEAGPPGQRQDLQGAPRRLQLPALLQGRGRGEPARGDHLLQPGRRPQCDPRGDWKIHFATIEGNIATGVRRVAGWPLIVNLRADPYEKMPARRRDGLPALVCGQHVDLRARRRPTSRPSSTRFPTTRSRPAAA